MKKTKRKTVPHLTELLVIGGVVAIAFFTPQFLFYIQDRIQWGKTELSQREGMDVEALRSTYENSLYKRMNNYAEGLSAGDHFYIASKNLTVSQTLWDYLYSEKGFYQNIMDYLFYTNIIPFNFLDQDCEMEQWKQYVIYSDNYTEGVNFILWYIELLGIDGMRLKLLTDAEDGTLYALKLEGCQWLDYGYETSAYESPLSESDMLELWGICGIYYEAFESFTSDEELAEYIKKSVGEMGEGIYLDGESEGDVTVNYRSQITDGEEREFQLAYPVSEDAIIDYVMSRIQVRTEDGENRIVFQLPYDSYSLEVLMKSRSRQAGLPDDMEGAYLMYPDTTIGIRQIYEMIPEFSENE